MSVRPVVLDDQAEGRLTLTGASEGVQRALLAYILDRHPIGDFLRAVLSNDLREAVGRADEINGLALRALVRWLYNEAPGACWGSPDAVARWLEDRQR